MEKTRKIQEDYVQNLTREDGTLLNITLIGKDTCRLPCLKSAKKGILF